MNELLRRSYIRENLSLCVVTALLMPKKDGIFMMSVNNRVPSTRLHLSIDFSFLDFDDLLDTMVESSTFLNVDFRSGYH